MNNTVKSILLWLLAVILTCSAAIYQRMTGPTYPVSGDIEIAGENVDFKLLRTDEISEDEEFTTMKIVVPEGVYGEIKYRRVSSFDKWTFKKVSSVNDTLTIQLPQLKELAGKYEYQVSLISDDDVYKLTEEPINIRYKGIVPDWVLIPHIFFMFFAMLFSTRTGVAAIAREKKSTLIYTQVTLIFLLIGGLILGPLVQKYAFDAYWTGWPFGTDLTDNKTIIAFLFWALAWFMLKKDRTKYIFPIIASIVLLAVYGIPHSANGSEYNYKKGEGNHPTQEILKK